MGDGMYSTEKLSEIAMQNVRDIARLKADVDSAHRRIDENDKLTEGIHQLAENVATMSVEVKMLTEKVDTSVEEIKGGLKEHGERLKALESEPAQKWKKFVWAIIAAIITAGVGFLSGRFLQ